MDIQKFRWYKFDGIRTVRFERAHKQYDLEIEKGDVFGIRVARNKIQLLHSDETSITFKVDAKEIKRVIDKSNGFKGKVDGERVLPGTQGKDMRAQSKPKGKAPKHTTPLDMPELREQKQLSVNIRKVKFPGIKSAKWLTAQLDIDGETPIHYYDVKSTLLNYRRKMSLPVGKYGDWADELAATVENAIPGVYCEAGTVRYQGNLVHVLVVTDDL
tara:strand:- start:3964 stop:4608 length:645 start_codon:yes stop_codon:yes gene_type:complete